MAAVLPIQFRNIAFAHNDWVEKAGTVLSGYTWNPALPLTNLKTLKLSEIARSLAPNLLDPYILVDFDAGVGLRPPVSGILIPRHNLSSTARWRLRLGPDAAMPPATTAYDTRPELGSTTAFATLPVVAPVTYPLTIEENISFAPGVSVKLTAIDNPAVALIGSVYSYDHNLRRLVLNIVQAIGSGVYGAWTVTRQDADIRVWPETRAIGTGIWGDDYTWGGILAVGPNYRPPAVHMIPLASGITDPFYQRYARLDFSDPANPDGRIDVSKLVIAAIWQPEHNINPGWDIEPVDPSPRTRSRGGTIYVDPREQFNRITIQLSEMSKEEAFSQVYEFQAKLGVRRPCIISVDPGDGTNLHRLTLYGSLVSTAAIRQDYTTESYSVQLKFEAWK